MLTLVVASVFLNGVNVDGLRSQQFEKCRTVRIDERGDVHLDCPGYEVKRPAAAVPASTAAPAAPPIAPLLQSAVAAALTKRYWLVTEEKDSAQFDVDVFVNAKFIRKIRAGEPQVVLEITRYLHPGANKVLFAATKRADAKKSAAPGSFLRLVVGEGDAGGNTVTIDNPLIETKRTASETENVNEEFTVQGR